MLPLPSIREWSCGNGSVCTGVLAAQIAGKGLSGDNWEETPKGEGL